MDGCASDWSLRLERVVGDAAAERFNGDMQRTVMVVEDDDAIRMVLRTNLEDEGYRVLGQVTTHR